MQHKHVTGAASHAGWKPRLLATQLLRPWSRSSYATSCSGKGGVRAEVSGGQRPRTCAVRVAYLLQKAGVRPHARAGALEAEPRVEQRHAFELHERREHDRRRAREAAAAVDERRAPLLLTRESLRRRVEVAANVDVRLVIDGN